MVLFISAGLGCSVELRGFVRQLFTAHLVNVRNRPESIIMENKPVCP